MQCAYCFTDAGKKRDNELTTGDRKDILRQASGLGTKTWYIAGDGEPLLDTDVLDLVDYANQRGLYVIMFTNGTHITEQLARRMKAQGISPIVKWNSLDAGIFQELTGYDNIKIVTRDGVSIPLALDILLNYGFAEGEETRVGIETVVTKQNQSDIPIMKQFCEKNNIYPHIEALLLEGRAVKNKEFLIPEDHHDIPAHLKADICGKRFTYSMYIRSDGEAYICFGNDPRLSLGNIRDYPSLQDLVEKKDIQAKQILRNNPGLRGCVCQAMGRGRTRLYHKMLK